MKKVFSTRILENSMIASRVGSLRLHYPEVSEVIPGQFVNLYLNRQDLLLPRPISICRHDEDTITLVYGIVGKGTEELAGCRPGAELRVSTPLGNGYDLSVFASAAQRANTFQAPVALLVGGGIGVPPLLELTYRLLERNISVHAVLGFAQEPFLVQEFQDAGASVHLAVESGMVGFRGTVISLLENTGLTGDFCFSCGPVPMLKAVSKYCDTIGSEVQISLEERMGCGFGACVGCSWKIRTASGIVSKRVCKDGPVFRGSEVVWND